MCTDSTKKLNWPLQPKFKAQLENWLENIGFKDLKKRPENLKSLIFAFFLFILQYRLQKKTLSIAALFESSANSRSSNSRGTNVLVIQACAFVCVLL